MSLKLVTIDVDGTLLNSNLQITKAVFDTVQKAKSQGVKIVLTTGRPILSVKPVLKELNLDGQSDQYVMTYNGGLIMSTDGTVIDSNPLDMDIVLAIDEFSHNAGTYTQFETVAESVTTWHEINEWGSFENQLIHMPLTIFEDKADFPIDEYIKGIMTDDKEIIDERSQLIPESWNGKVNVIRSTANNLEFVNPNVSKGNALKQLANHLNIDLSDTMAIGDQQNDFSMIEAAGIGVAMGNGIDAVKEIAQFVTETNDDSGVSIAIEKYL
ncbi:MAG: Cof-type HAD-IIB family hydrolase [Lactobacillaceae bacterium]|jgi:Cof subfamily protein (haloacid dehalogenase superfamily)|nr:Cof-type HAD-IIB family hydrolase [Lactobacillaceae bacterium]